MKTKLYTLLAGLLMAACTMSYGQELLGEFTHSNGLLNSTCTIVEAADGNLLIGSNVYPDDTAPFFVVFKYTPEGELLDSLTFPARSYLWTANPTNLETQVYAAFVTEETTGAVKIDFIDSNFGIENEMLVPIPNYNENCTSYGSFFFDTQNDLIASYWDDDQFHFVRIGLDGTLKQDKEVEGLFPPAAKPDTTVYYMGTKLFNHSPQQFSLLGDIYNTYRWPVVGYTFDDDFNNIDKHVYYLIKDEVLVNGGMGEHLTSFDEDSYLLAARIEHGFDGFAGLIKFSRANHEPMNIQLFEGNDPYHYNVCPSDTKVLDDHNIYFSYLTHVSTNNSVALVRTAPNLDQIWKVTLPSIPQHVFGDAKITVLRDGRIVLGANVYNNNYSQTDLHIYLIHDGYDSTDEMANIEQPFTLYPSPVKDILNIRISDNTRLESVRLFDMTGRLVDMQHDGLERIDMSIMPCGIYVLNVTTKDGASYYEKIVKE